MPRPGPRTKSRLLPHPREEKSLPDIGWYKAALNRLGYYVPNPTAGITDDPDEANFQNALYAFQRQATVRFDDTKIGPGSTTKRVLMDALERMDDAGRYVWRAVADDKVRGEHAARAGKIFSWDAPPDGEHPGDDYNCRCWAEPLNPSRHPWAVWAREQAETRARQGNALQNLAPPLGLKDDISDLKKFSGFDAVEPSYLIEKTMLAAWTPKLAFEAGKEAIRVAVPLAKVAAPIIQKTVHDIAENNPALARLRDTSWIKNASQSQLKRKFKHAKDFGIKGNQNKQKIEAYKKALEKHIKSSDTVVKEGKLHGKSVTHYLNQKTRIDVIKDSNGEYLSGWELSPTQMKYVIKTGKLGGGK